MDNGPYGRIRQLLDEALTYQDRASARKYAFEGIRLAQEKECIPQMMYFRAQMEIILERYEKAITFLDKAIKFDPRDGAAYNDKALCLLELGFIEGVEELFDKGIAAEPNYATVLHNKGWFLNKLGRHYEALELFKKALRLEPRRAVTYENMANALENVGLKRNAITAYKHSLRLLNPAYERIARQLEFEIRRLEQLIGKH